MHKIMNTAFMIVLCCDDILPGTELRKLPIDPCTLTEIVRLHFLASGGQTGSEDSKWRYQQRGAYTCHDDPGLEFRMQEAGILKTLLKGNLFDLSPGELNTYIFPRDFSSDPVALFSFIKIFLETASEVLTISE